MNRRVVVTGMAGITALGNDWTSIRANMAAGQTGTRHMPGWANEYDLRTQLAAPVPDFDISDRFSRKQLRSSGRVAQFAIAASDQALTRAGLRDETRLLKSGRVGVAYGSSFGSTPPVLGFTRLITDGTSNGISATSYIQMMSHTTCVNIGILFGICGRIIPTSTACTSGSMAIGYACEAIRYGQQDIMIAGGAEELCPSEVAVFDTLFATSVRNTEPARTPRPYDRDRDGLVIGEGSGTLILEAYEHAVARGAPILAEVTGFGTNTDGVHVTQQSEATMADAMRLALADASLATDDIQLVNGHGTATEHGDRAESLATHAVFGKQIAFHSLKGHFGHTLGACGAIESWLGLEMLREQRFVPTANLEQIDPDCAELDYIHTQPRELAVEHFMSNNFAFGGINTSLIFHRCD